MPFTPTHMAAILPLALVSRTALPFSALAIGSMIPDWPLFVPQPVDYGTTHSLRGIVTACLPLGILVWFLFQFLMKRPLTDLLPRAIRSRVDPLANAPPDLSISGVVKLALAILLGAFTHLLWDSFTHHDRWGTHLFPSLETPVLIVGGSRVPGYKILQYASTLICLPGMILYLGVWLSGRQPISAEDQTNRVRSTRIVAGIAVVVIPIVATFLTLYADRGTHYDQFGRMITTSGLILAMTALAYAVVDRARQVPLVRHLARLVSTGLAITFSLLGLSSYFAYTTAGLDFETPTLNGVDVLYLRLRWDDGSTWAGFAVQPCPQPTRTLDWFDPGGTLFAKPTRPAHRTRWNDFGFWRVEAPTDDPYLVPRYRGATASRWWACPSWLVWVGLWGRALSKGIGRTLIWRKKTMLAD